MTIYNYLCPACKHEQDVERKMTDPELEYFCDLCTTQLVRVFNAPTIQFIGKGFYKNGG